jgi:cytochrome c oxidase subunit 2
MPSKATKPATHSGWRIFVILALATVIAELAPRAQTQQPAKTIVIHAQKFAFAPSEVTLKKGETVKLVLISDDVRHGLAVRGVGIRSEIMPHRQNELIVTPTEVGDFPGTCWVFCGSGHHDMAFTIHVVE